MAPRRSRELWLVCAAARLRLRPLARRAAGLRGPPPMERRPRPSLPEPSVQPGALCPYFSKPGVRESSSFDHHFQVEAPPRDAQIENRGLTPTVRLGEQVDLTQQLLRGAEYFRPQEPLDL